MRSGLGFRSYFCYLHYGGRRYSALVASQADMAICMTCFRATLCWAAAARQSSNSGAALSSSVSKEPTLMRMGPKGVETV